MFKGEEDVEAHARFKQGWSISAIARHLDRDRKTVRSYLAGKQSPANGEGASPIPSIGSSPIWSSGSLTTHTCGHRHSSTRSSPCSSPLSYQSFTRGRSLTPGPSRQAAPLVPRQACWPRFRCHRSQS